MCIGLTMVFITAGASLAGLNDGLVAYYPFNGNANDESGNGNNGTVLGATLTADRLGNPNSAYSFNDNSQYIKMPNHLPESADISFSMWIYLTAFDTTRRTVFFDGDNTYMCDLHLELLGGNMTAFWTKDSNGLYINDSYFINNTWFHIAGIADSVRKIKQIWINGAKAAENSNWNGTANIGCRNSTDSFQIASPTQSIWKNFNGMMDDIRIYNRALSESEIQELYSGSYRYTQAQLDQAVKAEQLKWDANGDGKIGLEDIIRMLQVIAGLRP